MIAEGQIHSDMYYTVLEEIQNHLIKVAQIQCNYSSLKYIGIKECELIYSYINGKNFVVGELPMEYKIKDTYMINKGVRYNINAYLLDTLNAIGGGSIKLIKSLMCYRRLGGSTTDKINYMCYLTNVVESERLQNNNIRIYSSYILGDNTRIESSMMPYEFFLHAFKFNGSASGGYIDKAFKLKDKGESLTLNCLLFKIIKTVWCIDSNSTLLPKIIWSTASRPKLMKVRGQNSKCSSILEGNPCSRLIAIGPLIESMLAYPIYYHVSKKLQTVFKQRGYGIAIGCNRLGSDWKKISENFKGATSILVGDYSKYDQSISMQLLEQGLETIINMLDVKDVYFNNYIRNYKKWFKENIVNSNYEIDDKIFLQPKGGMPSGTIWTSLLNSVINMIVIKESMKVMHIHNYKPVVYGDDHIIIIYDELKKDKDVFISEYSGYIRSEFGLKLDPESSYMSEPHEFYVTYSRPIYKPGDYLERGTRDLEPINIEYSDKPFLKYDHTVGTTHRWNYVFGKRVKFLQYYWLSNGLSLRPMRESIVRLLHPEKVTMNLLDHEIMCNAHLIDNYHNAHVRNWMYHIFYDLEFLKRNRMTENQLFINRSDKGKSYYTSNTHPGSRMWYRRVDGNIDLNNEMYMAAFNNTWKKKMELIDDIISNEIDVEPYEVKRLITAQLSLNQVSYDRVYCWYENGLISLSELQQYKYKNYLNKENANFADRLKNDVNVSPILLYMISILGLDDSNSVILGRSLKRNVMGLIDRGFESLLDNFISSVKWPDSKSDESIHYHMFKHRDKR